MKKIVLSLCFLVCISQLYAQKKPLSVLFIGNSYTGSNNLPGMVKEIADNLGDSIQQSNFSGGGQTLRDHSNPNSGVMMEINSGKWDVVVIQEQSQLPAFPDDQVQQDFYPYAHFLDSSAKAANPCVKVLFYMTWGRKNGDAQNCDNFPPICTYKGMDSLLRLRYTIAAQQNNSMISAVGPVRKYLREKRPEIELYEPDGSHPSYAGTYAAACCFYSSIFQKSAMNIGLNFILDSVTADHIKRAVDSVVLMQLDTWRLNAFKTKALFNTQILSNQTIRFTNLSNNADSFVWDLGDGNYSNLKVPNDHLYEKGKFTVKLKVYSKCGGIDSISKEITIANSALHQVKNNTIIAYPNPANEKIQFKFQRTNFKYTIYNSLGQKIDGELKQENTLVELNVIDFNSGIYTIVLQDVTGNLTTVSFLKQ